MTEEVREHIIGVFSRKTGELLSTYILPYENNNENQGPEKRTIFYEGEITITKKGSEYIWYKIPEYGEFYGMTNQIKSADKREPSEWGYHRYYLYKIGGPDWERMLELEKTREEYRKLLMQELKQDPVTMPSIIDISIMASPFLIIGFILLLPFLY